MDSKFAGAEDEVGVGGCAGGVSVRSDKAGLEVLPKWIANDEEDNVGLVGTGKNIITASLDQFTIRFNDRAAVELFLLVLY